MLLLKDLSSESQFVLYFNKDTVIQLATCLGIKLTDADEVKRILLNEVFEEIKVFFNVTNKSVTKVLNTSD